MKIRKILNIIYSLIFFIFVTYTFIYTDDTKDLFIYIGLTVLFEQMNYKEDKHE